MDMAAKGRHGGKKLTPADVVEIRVWLAQGQNPKVIGPRFGVHRDTIRQIASGRTWRHVK
jgi:hypothetical protein